MHPIQEEKKDTRKRKGSGLDGVLKGIQENAAKGQELFRLLEQQRIEEHQRVSGILAAAFGGAHRPLLKSSIVISDDDRQFLKSLNYL